MGLSPSPGVVKHIIFSEFFEKEHYNPRTGTIYPRAGTLYSRTGTLVLEQEHYILEQ